MISPKKGDYVSFERCILPAVKVRVNGASSRHDYIANAEEIVDIPGSGQVRSVSENRKKVGSESVRTMRVDTGKTNHGIVTAVLDESCEYTGIQVDMFGSSFDVAKTQASMYDVTGDGA